MHKMRMPLMLASAMAACYMMPTDGEASTNPNPTLAADAAALNDAQAKVTSDEAQLAADKQALADAQAKLDNDTAAANAEAAEEVTHPVVGVLHKMEALVSRCEAEIVNEFHSLLAEARGLIDAPPASTDGATYEQTAAA